MILTGLRISRRSIALKSPFITALRRVDAVESVLVELICDEGLHGFGEAPPTKAITGEDLGSITHTIETFIKPALLGKPFDTIEGTMEALHGSCEGNSSAKAAVDIALYDLFSKKAGLPLCTYLGGEMHPLISDVTISLDTPEKMAEESARALEGGLNILKVKVGGRDGRDIERIKAVREAAPDAALYIDANQAWEEDEALEIIQAVQGLNITLIEQPLPASDLKGLQRVTGQSGIPILADESVFDYDDALKIIESGSADMINIKLMKCGGIHKAAEILKLCRRKGVTCMMGSMLEGPVSIAAAAHLAMAFSETVKMVDLDSPLLYTAAPEESPVRFLQNRLMLTSKTGI